MTDSDIAATMPGSVSRAIGTPCGRPGSASSFSTPIHSDWMSFTPFSFASVPARGVATQAMSIGPSGLSRKRSCGSAFSRSGIQNSAFSVSLANRMFTRAGMLASPPEVLPLRPLAFLLAAVLSLPAAAQDWPKHKPIHIVVGFAPASTTDLVARVVAPRLQEALSQSVIVENKPGAGGNLAAQQVKRAAPDGYTLFVTSVAYAVNPTLYANAGYDPFTDFIPVILGPSTPNIITVNPAVPVKNLQELVALARKEKLSYASSGVGTTTHLSMERIKMASKVDITHVPYQPAQAVGAAVAGHTQISSTSMPPAVQQVRAGRVRPIAVTSAQRSPALPQVPTVNEQGFTGFDDLTWTGVFAPAGISSELANRLNSEINRALSAADVQERLAQLGLEWKANTSGEFAAFLRDEVAKWSKAVRDSGARAD